MYPDDDFMELGNSGWIPSAEGYFFNIHSRHIIDDIGREYDENGDLIFDPSESQE
jgi:hypothetical protein